MEAYPLLGKGPKGLPKDLPPEFSVPPLLISWPNLLILALGLGLSENREVSEAVVRTD